MIRTGPRKAPSRAGSRPDTVYARAARRRPTSSMAFNLTPMIDVVFNLLIYFVISTSFIRAEGFLPGRMARLGSRAQVQTLPVMPIRLLMRTDGGPEYRVHMRLENSATVPRDYDDLCQILIGLRTGGMGFDNRTPVVIHAEDSVPWNHVVNAFNAAKRAGYEAISFGKARARR